MPHKQLFIGKPVPPHAFCGRNDLVASIENNIRDGYDVELIGPHRTGKSALLSFLAEKFASDATKIPVIINLQHLTTPNFSAFVTKITGKKISVVYEDKLYIGAAEEAVEELVSYAKNLGKQLVIFIDEIEAALADVVTFREWNASLRYLSRCCGSHIVLITSMAVHPKYFQNKFGSIDRTSLSIGSRYRTFMTPLAISLASDFVKHKTTLHKPINTAFALKFAGTFPFLLELVALEYNKASICDINYKQIIENVYQQAETFFSDLHEFVISCDNTYHTLRSIIYSLAFEQVITEEAKLTPKVKDKFDINDWELNVLKKVGIITENGEIFSPLFSWWLSRHALTGVTEADPMAPKILEFLGMTNLKDFLGVLKSAHSLSSLTAAAISAM